MVLWTHLSPQPNGISIGSAVFAQLTAERPYTLQWAAQLFPLKIAASHGDFDRRVINDSLAHDRAHNPNGISIGSSVLQGSLV